MSWKATAFVKDIREGITASEKYVLLLLAEYHNPAKNVAWPSIPTLAEDALFSERQTVRILASLEEKGFIARSRENSPHATTSYEIRGLRDVKMSPQKPSRDDIRGDIRDDIRGDICDIAIRKEPLEPLEPTSLILSPPSSDPPQKNKRFVPPTLEQVKTYCLERKNSVNPEHWFDFYLSKGWLVGRTPMKDWKAAVRTWEQNHNGGNGNGNVPYRERETADQARNRRSKEAIQRVLARDGQAVQ